MLSRDLTAVINTAIQCLVEFRPLSVSMGNAIKFVKLQARPGGPASRAAMCAPQHTGGRADSAWRARAV